MAGFAIEGRPRIAAPELFGSTWIDTAVMIYVTTGLVFDDTISGLARQKYLEEVTAT